MSEERCQFTLPLEISNVMITIGQSLEYVMSEPSDTLNKKISMQSISNKFFKRCGIPSNEWGFGDALFLRYFTKFSKAVSGFGKDFCAHATCFLTCICLLSRRDLIRLVVSIYSDHPSSQRLITYESFKVILQNVLEIKVGGNNKQNIESQYSKFVAYLSANPMAIRSSSEESLIVKEPILVFDHANCNPIWEEWSRRALSFNSCNCNIVGSNFVSTNLVVQFCAVKYVNTLWPLLMLQSQLRKVFMGEDFWIRWQHSEFYKEMSKLKVNEDVFFCTQVIYKLYKAAKIVSQQTNSNSNNIPVKASTRITNSSSSKNASNSSSSGSTSGDSGVRSSAIWKPTPDEPAAPPTSPLKTSLRVLIIEDSKAQRKIMMKRLQLASGQLQNNQLDDAWVMGSASSGEEALQIVQTHAFDIVIVDENLGGSGGKLMGHEVVKIMRESYNMTNTVIIGCTSNTQRNTTKLLEAGADSVWPKPMPDDSTILHQVAHFLERRHSPVTAVEDITFPTSPHSTKSPTGRMKAASGGRVQQIMSGRY